MAMHDRHDGRCRAQTWMVWESWLAQCAMLPRHASRAWLSVCFSTRSASSCSTHSARCSGELPTCQSCGVLSAVCSYPSNATLEGSLPDLCPGNALQRLGQHMQAHPRLNQTIRRYKQ